MRHWECRDPARPDMGGAAWNNVVREPVRVSCGRVEVTNASECDISEKKGQA